MKHVDERRLETDLQYRFESLSEFIGFDQQDIEAIHVSAGHPAPLIPGIVERTCEQLLRYDADVDESLPPAQSNSPMSCR